MDGMVKNMEDLFNSANSSFSISYCEKMRFVLEYLGQSVPYNCFLHIRQLEPSKTHILQEIRGLASNWIQEHYADRSISK